MPRKLLPNRWLLMIVILGTASWILTARGLTAAHPVLIQGNGQLAILDADGQYEWRMKWGGIHDVHRLQTGNIMVQQGAHKVVEVNPATRKVVWSYDASESNGNQGVPVEVHSFQPLADGSVMIAESGPARIIEVDREGRLLRQIKLKVDKPHSHHDTRLVRKLKSGNYLVCHENDGVVREYNVAGQVVWEYEVPLFGQSRKAGHGPEAYGNQLFAALRLDSGNTLIATGNGHRVLEVDPLGEVVWQLDQKELPGITLAWVTTLEVLPNGNYVIGNCHAGPENPLLIEIEPKSKRVVWTFDHFDKFGNSAPNSQILGLPAAAIR